MSESINNFIIFLGFDGSTTGDGNISGGGEGGAVGDAQGRFLTPYIGQLLSLIKVVQITLRGVY